MNSNKLFFITLIISVIFHFIMIFLFDITVEKSSNREEKPIDIEIIQKKDLLKEPINTPPVITDENSKNTTLDHDKLGGKSSDIEDNSKDNLPPVKQTPKSNINNNTDIPNTFIPDESFNSNEKLIEDKNINIKDIQDIIDRIANSKEKSKKGEDTASYNTFQERYASYFAKFRRRVYQVWNYPQESIVKGETGVVRATFSILKDGSIVNIKIVESSGYPNLDREVMRVLKSIGKIPLPDSYKLEQLNVDEAFFIYSIGGGIERYIR